MPHAPNINAQQGKTKWEVAETPVAESLLSAIKSDFMSDIDV